MTRSPALPYVAPFAVFICALALERALAIGEIAGELVLLGTTIPALWFVSRPAISLHVRRWGPSVSLGVLVFVLWAGPELVFPGYHQHWLFQNPITGAVGSTLAPAARTDAAALSLRLLRTVLIVPLAEELFWRGWLMRWLAEPDCETIAPGTYNARSFWIVAVLFASEHGPYWDVGLVAGILFNWWMMRAKSLGDLVLAHAVTNACLSAYVIATGKWEYWL